MYKERIDQDSFFYSNDDIDLHLKEKADWIKLIMLMEKYYISSLKHRGESYGKIHDERNKYMHEVYALKKKYEPKDE